MRCFWQALLWFRSQPSLHLTKTPPDLVLDLTWTRHGRVSLLLSPALPLNPSSSPSLSSSSSSLRACFVWRRQPQWWRGWRPAWIKKWSTTASSAWTLTLWLVVMCPFHFPFYFLLPFYLWSLTFCCGHRAANVTLAAHSDYSVPLLFAPNTAPAAASINAKRLISCVVTVQ